MPSTCTSTAFARGGTRRSAGEFGGSRSPSSACSRRSTERMWSSSAAAPRTSPRGWHAGRATRRGRHHTGAARDRAADAARRARVPADRGGRGGCAAGRRLVDLALSEYGASIWSIPTAGSRRRRGSCGRAASSSSCATRRSRSSARPRRPARDAAEAAARAAPPRLGGRRQTEFQLAHGDLFKLLREPGLRRPRPGRAPRAGRGEDAAYYVSDADWAKKWPWEEIWRARKR